MWLIEPKSSSMRNEHIPVQCKSHRKSLCTDHPRWNCNHCLPTRMPGNLWMSFWSSHSQVVSMSCVNRNINALTHKEEQLLTSQDHLWSCLPTRWGKGIQQEWGDSIPFETGKFWKGNQVGLIASFQTNHRGQWWECVEKHSLHVIVLGLEDNRRVVISECYPLR